MLRQVASLCGTPVVLSTLGLCVCADESEGAKPPETSNIFARASSVAVTGEGASGRSARVWAGAEPARQHVERKQIDMDRDFFRAFINKLGCRNVADR